MSLTDTAARKAKATGKSYKLFDGHGLYLLVSATGSKGWRFKYRYGGKEKLISLGPYPEISLLRARELCLEKRRQKVEGEDPSAVRKAQKAAETSKVEHTFAVVAEDWFSKHQARWREGHRDRQRRYLDNEIHPWIGDLPLAEISPEQVLKVAQRLEARGSVDTAHRVMSLMGTVFRWGVATRRGLYDPTAVLKGSLTPHKKKHYPTITDPKAIGRLLRDIDAYSGHFVTRCALKLSPYLMVRPGELRRAVWSEFDLAEATWRIPKERMKKDNQPHIVPLSKQVVELLTELHQLTGRHDFVFPSVRTWRKPISENTVNAALRAMGYSKDQIVGHGFRSMASTMLNELGYDKDWIERQLAHAERDETRASYNHADYLVQRRKMMQDWADYLDKLRAKR
jgi:integrase